MKKISLIAAAFLASLSLAACGNSASQHKAKQANSSSKVVPVSYTHLTLPTKA